MTARGMDEPAGVDPPYIRDTAIHLFVIPVLENSPQGAMFAKHILRTCSDDPCEAAVALTGVRDKVVVRGRHAPPGTDAEVGPLEDGHLCGVREAIVRERAG